MKEANKMAQLHKRNTPEIQKASRESTFLGSRENVLKNIKKVLKEVFSEAYELNRLVL